jgi:predicted phosphodiesterase
MLNPGSATVPRLSDPSVMLLDVNNRKLDAQIVKIGDSTCKALNFEFKKINKY